MTRVPPKNMCWIPGGEFAMGSTEFYPEEQPVHREQVQGFWLDEHPVTVAEFRRFVKATGHRTTAETAPSAEDFPDADPAQLVPGSLVFRPTTGPVRLDDYTQWWAWTPGADWRHPEGPAAPSTAATAIPSPTCPCSTPRRTPPGPARSCPPRRSGSTPLAAGWTAPGSPGDEELIHHRATGQQLAG